MQSVFELVGFVVILFVLLAICCGGGGQRRASHLEEPDEDGVIQVPVPDHVELVEINTQGRRLPPEKVMVHVYRWRNGAMRYEGVEPLSNYAIEEPEEPRERLPAAGDVW